MGRVKENWRTVEEFPVYEISDFGRLRRKITLRIITPKNSGRKYPYYSLYRDNKVHKRKIGQLVLLAFYGPRPFLDAECCHRDDDKTNNNIENLYWGTREQNLEDQRRNGKILRGNCHGQASITEDQVRLIKQEISQTPCSYGSGRRLAEKFGVSEHIISRLKLGKNWKSVIQ